MPANAPVDLLGFWGKAQPHDGAAHSWHPVAYHLLDVAATTDEILRARPLALRAGARLLGTSEADARRLLVALAALHDLGKFGRAFQAKERTLGERVFSAAELAGAGKTPHTADGYALWRDRLAPSFVERIWAGGGQALDVLAPAVFGHHGRPVLETNGLVERTLGAAGVHAAVACADMLLALLLPEPIAAPAPSAERARVASWWASGLLTVSDWVGSHQEWFPYQAPFVGDEALARYWEHARACAEQAVAAAGLRAVRAAPLRTFAELTKRTTPSPAQAWAERVALPHGPLLVILEDVTGAGKTEAAQMLVHRLMADGRATGAYWAMPTQATANAMYGRQAGALDALFAPEVPGHRPSLALAHGQTKLHEDFQAKVLGGVNAGDLGADDRASDDELPSSAACAAFLADDRRAALLADVGAGTIDQALLGVLPSRFNTVRLFGLADKVLVVDEAHAYDAYVHTELRELLRFQAALGGCAVVLSATLARAGRQSFVDAWADGVNGGVRAAPPLPWLPAPATPPTPRVEAEAYPLATVVARAPNGGVRVSEEPIAAASWSVRDVAVRLEPDVGAVVARLADAARRGATVVWVRNTVDSCLEGAALLRAQGLELMVFHARFAQGDRQAREREVLHRFGPDAAAPDRHGAVLVATQVVEQSLDLDFDVMVSDLAPVDLLIQRAGRLWRHRKRNTGRLPDLQCELVVLTPAADDDVAANWPKPLLPGTAAVYENVDVLWRTNQLLSRAHTIVTPGEPGSEASVRALVEGAYGDGDVPESLLRRANRADGKDRSHASTANQSALKVDVGYTANDLPWLHELRVPTRVGDDQRELRLARLVNGRLLPWVTGRDVPWKRWALSEIRVSLGRVPVDADVLPEYRERVATLRNQWPVFEQNILVLPLAEADGECWTGTLVVASTGVQIGVVYTRGDGLAFRKSDAYLSSLSSTGARTSGHEP